MYKTILQKKKNRAWTWDQLPYTQAVPLAGSIVKILPARGTRQREFEFGDSPNQELNKIIHFMERRLQKLLCLSSVPKSKASTRSLQCLYYKTSTVQNFTV